MSISIEPNAPASSAFDDIPPELLEVILSRVPTPSLAACCLVSKTFLAASLPLLYAHLKFQNLAGSLILLRGLQLAKSDCSFIARFAPLVRSISIPKTPATHEVKEAIAKTLASNVLSGKFSNLRILEWPFGYIRRGFLEDESAARFDEPLWEALLENCPKLDTIVIRSTAYQHPHSAIWTLADRCRVILATPNWELRVNGKQKLEPL